MTINITKRALDGESWLWLLVLRTAIGTILLAAAGMVWRSQGVQWVYDVALYLIVFLVVSAFIQAIILRVVISDGYEDGA